LPQTCGVQGIGDMTDDGLGATGRVTRPQLQTAMPAQDPVVGLSSKSRTTLGNQIAVHHLATASLVIGGLAPARTPHTDSGA
jgi:hypothetical protein